jgi:hypothetical protein
MDTPPRGRELGTILFRIRRFGADLNSEPWIKNLVSKTLGLKLGLAIALIDITYYSS